MKSLIDFINENFINEANDNWSQLPDNIALSKDEFEEFETWCKSYFNEPKLTVEFDETSKNIGIFKTESKNDAKIFVNRSRDYFNFIGYAKDQKSWPEFFTAKIKHKSEMLEEIEEFIKVTLEQCNDNLKFKINEA